MDAGFTLNKINHLLHASGFVYPLGVEHLSQMQPLLGSMDYLSALPGTVRHTSIPPGLKRSQVLTPGVPV